MPGRNNGNNEITKIPEWICLFKDLETLNIGDNLFLSLPNCILTLKKLRKLKLFSRYSKLNTIPSVVLEFAKHKTVKKYLQLGVAPNEAYILGLLDIIDRSSLERINYYLIHQINQTQECSCFKTDDKGHIMGVYIIGGEDIRIGLIPEQICKLKYL